MNALACVCDYMGDSNDVIFNQASNLKRLWKDTEQYADYPPVIYMDTDEIAYDFRAELIKHAKEEYLKSVGEYYDDEYFKLLNTCKELYSTKPKYKRIQVI